MSAPAAVKHLVSTRLPTEFGDFQLHLFADASGKEHLAMLHGELQQDAPTLVRVHSECFTGEVLRSLRCDCGEQLRLSLQAIAAAGRGVLIYLRQEGRGIGLYEKLRAYNLQDEGLDTVEANLALGHQADARNYDVAAHILSQLGIAQIALLTNNPNKIEELQRLGISVTERLPLEGAVNPENARYLHTKVDRMQHLLKLPRSTNSNGAA